MECGAKSELQIHKYYFICLAIILLFPQEAHFRPQNSPNEIYFQPLTNGDFMQKVQQQSAKEMVGGNTDPLKI